MAWGGDREKWDDCYVGIDQISTHPQTPIQTSVLICSTSLPMSRWECKPTKLRFIKPCWTCVPKQLVPRKRESSGTRCKVDIRKEMKWNIGLHTSLPTSRWERKLMKLRFIKPGWTCVPKQPVPRKRERLGTRGKRSFSTASFPTRRWERDELRHAFSSSLPTSRWERKELKLRFIKSGWACVPKYRLRTRYNVDVGNEINDEK